AEELLEATVLGQPCADLGEQGFGDVDGAAPAGLLEGDVLAGVQGPAAVAAAGGAAAAVGVGAEGGGQDGGGGGELLEPALEHAEDEGRVIGDAHGTSAGRRGQRDRKSVV